MPKKKIEDCYLYAGQIIKARRRMLGWSQENLAERMHMSLVSIQHIESGIQRFLYDDAKKFELILGVTL